jgi:hypothetical protein
LTIKRILLCLIVLLVSVPVLADNPRLTNVIRFNDYEIGSEEDWLQSKGFEFKEDMKRRNRIDLGVNDDSLVIEAKRGSFGIMVNEAVNVPDFTFIEIDWGVNKFPEGASYEQGVRNEAIMVIIFMGDERMPSGSIFIPDSPYFIGLFLCHNDDRINHPYRGSYFKKSGRYVCGDRPAEGETVTTRFDLLKAYRAYFDKEGDDDPGISGLGIALDTKKAQGGGRSSAFIREIRIYR